MAQWRHKSGSHRSVGLWCTAGVVTVLLHAAFVGSLAFGSKGRLSQPPLTEGLQASTLNRGGDQVVSVMIFIPDKSIHQPDEGNESNYAAGDEQKIQTESSALIASMSTGSAAHPPSLEAAEGADDEQQDAFGDGSEAALLFGRYMGQIKARIERAWEHAQPVPARSAACRVQIRQSATGQVNEITIQSCSLDPDAQIALVRAIQAASPLNAPPHEKLFTEVITLNFTTPSHVRLGHSM